MEKEASQLEKDHVHSVYEKIAPHFHDARYKAWPKVQQFLSDQEPGSLIADIGCGNGKYLHINSQTYKLGCDYCFPLVESARNVGHEVMVCHSLYLPYRNECFDTVLSIAEIAEQGASSTHSMIQHSKSFQELSHHLSNRTNLELEEYCLSKTSLSG
ncbi:putative tRNA methyltransferase 9B isoform X3 [Pelodiscus sinensis]|uniref:putative tRNA methyltransferase 9B isoform X3 n=1 Tax=Pelodiscus sinensis TaxID=13735 RepID=UPI000D71F431|nr:probable tRNA methyltransferase 9B isoform X3 [Pelodiscus sinensis]|eukprot:XP_025045993.1 probable tRNA methyltransferase 9B isoform X3 [Pelodiscus sinensis]